MTAVPATLPCRLGRWELVGVLGRGAMGMVYEGRDAVTGQAVAVKTVRPELEDEALAAEHARRLRIEARAAARLDHPAIVRVLDQGEARGLAYLVMERVQGRELKAALDAGQAFTLAQVLRLMGELLDALGHAHARGVVHRDVKPANLFLTVAGGLKLADFGIARLDDSQVTQAGMVIGTPSHMAPEQVRGEVADARADLYAAGVVLYQLLTGQRPFTGGMVAVMHQVLYEAPPPPSVRRPALGGAFDALLARALAKAPAQRFQDAAAFRQALLVAAEAAEAAGDLPLPFPGSGTGADDGSTVHAWDAVRDRTVRLPAWARRRTPVLLGSGLAALLAAGGLTWWPTRPGMTETGAWAPAVPGPMEPVVAAASGRLAASAPGVQVVPDAPTAALTAEQAGTAASSTPWSAPSRALRERGAVATLASAAPRLPPQNWASERPAVRVEPPPAASAAARAASPSPAPFETVATVAPTLSATVTEAPRSPPLPASLPAVPPSASAPVQDSPPAPPPVAPEELMRRAARLLREGHGREAAELLVQAGRAGHGPASRRLMELYAGGGPGLGRDYAQAVRWKRQARAQGEDVEE